MAGGDVVGALHLLLGRCRVDVQEGGGIKASQGGSSTLARCSIYNNGAAVRASPCPPRLRSAPTVLAELHLAAPMHAAPCERRPMATRRIVRVASMFWLLHAVWALPPRSIFVGNMAGTALSASFPSTCRARSLTCCT